MPDKTLTYIQLAQDTARQITSNYRSWTAYLSTASRLYKYQYSDQLLIHAQRPDATACAEYDLWNSTMHRYQIAHRLNESGRIYEVDVAQVQAQHEQLWNMLNSLLEKLNAVG